MAYSPESLAYKNTHIICQLIIYLLTKTTLINVKHFMCKLYFNKNMSNPLNGHTEYFQFNQLRTRTKQERKI